MKAGISLAPGQEEIDLLIRQMLNIGEAMYYAGAEISRIEDTLHRIGRAYGAEHTNVYAITSSIVVTIEFPGYPALTQSRRIRRDSMDLMKLEHLNDLCRRCTARPLPVCELQTEVLSILKETPDPSMVTLGVVLAAGGFAIFFGGSLADGLAAGAAALLIRFLQLYLRPLCSGQVFFNVLVSFFTGTAICLLTRLLPFLGLDFIMIGDIMVLIPGLAITTSLRYTLSGDSISGVEKLIDSLLQASGIAVGFYLAIFLFR